MTAVVEVRRGQRLLEQKNQVASDGLVDFDAEKHKYRIRVLDERIKDEIPQDKIISVTTWIGMYFPKFDKKAALAVMNRGPGSEYYGMTDEEIEAKWDNDGKVASERGTDMHENMCERAVNGEEVEKRWMITPEWGQFHRLLLKRGWIPFRSEIRLFHPWLWIAGTCDMIFTVLDKATGQMRMIIVDWKRSKEIVLQNRYNQFGYKPFDKVPAINYWKYSLQLNIYLDFFEFLTQYKIADDGLFIVQFHPNRTEAGEFQAPRMTAHVAAMKHIRLQEVNMAVMEINAKKLTQDGVKVP